MLFRSRMSQKQTQKSVLSLGRLISLAFRKKRHQADSCDVSLTSTPTTTISATVGGAFNLPSFDGANFAVPLDFFHSPKPCITRQRACDSCARRSFADASIGSGRSVAHTLQTVRSTSHADDSREALNASLAARSKDFGMSVSLPLIPQLRTWVVPLGRSASCQIRTNAGFQGSSIADTMKMAWF